MNYLEEQALANFCSNSRARLMKVGAVSSAGSVVGRMQGAMF